MSSSGIRVSPPRLCALSHDVTCGGWLGDNGVVYLRAHRSEVQMLMAVGTHVRDPGRVQPRAAAWRSTSRGSSVLERDNVFTHCKSLGTVSLAVRQKALKLWSVSSQNPGCENEQKNRFQGKQTTLLFIVFVSMFLSSFQFQTQLELASQGQGLVPCSFLCPLGSPV